MESAELLGEIREMCPGASLQTEGGVRFIDLPRLKIPLSEGDQVLDGLLAIDAHNGYPTRLYLSERIANKGANWNVFSVLARTWHACSWGNVLPTLRPIEILTEHLRAFR